MFVQNKSIKFCCKTKTNYILNPSTPYHRLHTLNVIGAQIIFLKSKPNLKYRFEKHTKQTKNLIKTHTRNDNF